MDFTLKKTRRKAFATMILVALTIALIPVLLPSVKVNSALGASTAILPASNIFYANQTNIGTVFIVNATVVNVTDLQNFQIRMEWNASFLSFVNITRPPDNVFAGSGKDYISVPAVVGPNYVMSGYTYLNGEPGTPDYWTFNGTGTLFQIALRINITQPTPPPFACNLSLTNVPDDTFLVDGLGLDIPFTVEDAIFRYEYENLQVSLSPPGTVVDPYDVDYGQTVTFTANATKGAPPYRYQWYFKYPNGTEAEVTSAENQTSWVSYPIIEMGNYQTTVKVTDNIGVQVNASSVVSIRALSLVLSPLFPSVNVDGVFTFTATISGGILPYKIQWYRNDTEQTALQNMTVAAMTFSVAGIENIRVRVTDSAVATDEKATVIRVYATPSTFVNVVSATGSGTFYTNVTKVGDKIKYNVTVVGVIDLQNWQINMTWDPTLLNFSSITTPTDHVFAYPEAQGYTMLSPDPVVEPGNVLWGLTYQIIDPFPYWTFNGTGVLCQLELTVIRQPDAPQSSKDIGLVNQYADTFILQAVHEGEDFPKDIPFIINNGTYTYVLVQRVTHLIVVNPTTSFTISTYSNTSVIANSGVPNQTAAYIDLFNITGAPGTGAYVNFTLPKAGIRLLNITTDHWIVSRDGVDVTSQAIITEDATNTYIYLAFTFTDTDTVIRVDGTWMIPEQMLLLLIALLIVSMTAVIFTKVAPRKKWIK